MKARIGITGSSGFIGKNLARVLEGGGHAVNYFNLSDNNLLKPNPALLKKFIRESDIIIHTAAVNRGTDTEIISGSVVTTYNLIDGLVKNKVGAKIIFLSSIHAESDNVYGRSKKLAEVMLEDFSRRHNNPVTVFRLPNVFGEGGKPFYNSVVHTFCYQVANGQRPNIIIDQKIKLIHIDDLIKLIVKEVAVTREKLFYSKTIVAKNEIVVSDLLKLIRSFRKIKSLSKLSNKFHRNLYTTYLYIKNHE